ncbi:hypothetical protein ACFL6E_02750 [Candidatus Neomarinimicrobiota bacterium]
MMKSTYILALLSAVLWFGCSKDKGPTRSERIQAYIDAGWTEYAANEFTDARDEFGSALDLDSTSAGAQVGYAWSTMQIPRADVRDVFSIITNDATEDLTVQTDAWTVMSGAHLVLREYPPADSLALLVLTTDSSYVFTNDPNVDWRDVLLLRGQALYFMSFYDSSWTVIQPLVIGTNYEHIDYTDPTTWSISTNPSAETYTIFAGVVSIILEALTEDYR